MTDSFRTAFLDSLELRKLVDVSRERKGLLAMLAGMDAFAGAGIEYLNGPRSDSLMALKTAEKSIEICELIGERLDANRAESNLLLGITPCPECSPLEAARKAWAAKSTSVETCEVKFHFEPGPDLVG